MENLIKETAILALSCWLEPGAELPGWDILKDGPFGARPPHPEEGKAAHSNQLIIVQNYLAEYHLEYFRPCRHKHFQSCLHARFIFAARADVMTFRCKHPQRVFGNNRVHARTRRASIRSFRSSSWPDHLHLAQSALDEVAKYCCAGKIIEEVDLTFMNVPWKRRPITEIPNQGPLEPLASQTQSGWAPGFC